MVESWYEMIPGDHSYAIYPAVTLEGKFIGKSIYDNVGAHELDADQWVFMQFTGLTCNGHEWYEGDILESDSDWYRIAWDNDDARWEAVGIKGTGETLALSELLSQETWVQGNIYENPELLSA